MEKVKDGSPCSCCNGRSHDGEGKNSLHWQVSGGAVRGGLGKVNMQHLRFCTSDLDDIAQSDSCPCLVDTHADDILILETEKGQMTNVTS